MRLGRGGQGSRLANEFRSSILLTRTSSWKTRQDAGGLSLYCEYLETSTTYRVR